MTKNKNCRIDMRVTKEELSLLRQLAQKSNMTLSHFLLKAAFNVPITVYEIDPQILIKPLLGLQRHYNNIRFNLQQGGELTSIITPQYEEEIQSLWQLLAKAKPAKVPSEV
ncbi:hypothetical protein [Veillonella sp.]|uniref:plasmid mobilization protein n=1 Tax=Veillonella sp. TaxID=1926307 RepID=UPI001B59E2B7|nr:hypothetical protein [Veillonella sp.]MBP8616528.1 hypothetical protein [Veillonella sp.]